MTQSPFRKWWVIRNLRRHALVKVSIILSVAAGHGSIFDEVIAMWHESFCLESTSEFRGNLIQLFPLRPLRIRRWQSQPETIVWKPCQHVQVCVENLLPGSFTIGEEEIYAIASQARLP